MPRPRKTAPRDEFEFESEDDLYADPDDFVEGLRYAVARARCSVSGAFDLGAGRCYVDLDSLGAADFGD
ncbi:hypothetical protein [Amaricoccus solimangrovi]|uniref:Uncharacterized protein n=1 Tax=Amaricoccus solimangrovi TaxID=2589815 RepID=A0A501WX62_9RHOB|nr:hypothetical protein [Amaricoccus solimangrovi]TPE50466.1 hypothetical protein FJM51_11770 [Amaricoccus solimangrovi]